MKTLISRLLIFSFLVSSISCSDDDDSNQNNNASPQTIATKLAADSQYSILSDALNRTGLAASLSNAGTYTIFAPNNNAFNALIGDMGYSDLDGLIQGIGLAKLRDILSYHLMNEERSWASFETGYYKSMTVSNLKDSLSFYANKGTILELNESAVVINPDLDATNGIIHGISSVLQPLSVYGLLEVNPRYSSLEAAIGLADGDLRSTLSNENSTFTVFAPNNAAFDTIVARTPNVSNLFEFVASLGTGPLANLILYHSTNSALLAEDLQTGNLTTMATGNGGVQLQIFVNIGSEVRLIDNSSNTEDAVVRRTDIIATNGVIHLIDAVMLTD